MSIKVILDPGSTHMGKIEYMKELVNKAIELGADFIKPQIGVKEPNIDFPSKWWGDINDMCHGKIGLIASFFSDEAFGFLTSVKPLYIKFAYSQKHQIDKMVKCLDNDIIPIVSCDVMTYKAIPNKCIKLWCDPTYPVKYLIDFEGIFNKFDGLSSHCLGLGQDKDAIARGARWLEKHFMLDYKDIDCPDASFALNTHEVKMIVDWIRSYEKRAWRGCA